MGISSSDPFETCHPYYCRSVRQICRAHQSQRHGLHGLSSPKRPIISAYSIAQVLQGVSPMLFGTLGDYLGRRPMFILCLLILTASCVGLALVPTSSYALLMVLRCIQATGSASTIALGASKPSTYMPRRRFFNGYSRCGCRQG